MDDLENKQGNKARIGKDPRVGWLRELQTLSAPLINVLHSHGISSIADAKDPNLNSLYDKNGKMLLT
jgi:hypothetical protein